MKCPYQPEQGSREHIQGQSNGYHIRTSYQTFRGNAPSKEERDGEEGEEGGRRGREREKERECVNYFTQYTGLVVYFEESESLTRQCTDGFRKISECFWFIQIYWK